MNAGAKGYLLDTKNTLAYVYERAGKPHETVHTPRKLMALKNEVALRDREKVISEAQEKFTTERKDHEKERLYLGNSVHDAVVVARATI